MFNRVEVDPTKLFVVKLSAILDLKLLTVSTGWIYIACNLIYGDH